VRVPGSVVEVEAERRMVRLAPEAARTVVRQYEGWLDRLVQHPASGRRMTWRRLIEEQAIDYGQAVLGDGEDYRPYVMDY